MSHKGREETVTQLSPMSQRRMKYMVQVGKHLSRTKKKTSLEGKVIIILAL